MARDTHFLTFFMPPEPPPDVWRPPADVYSLGNGWLVKFDLAGVRAEDVEVCPEGRELVVRGCRRDWVAERGCRHYRMEISYSRFERRVELPADLLKASIATEYQDGMLLVKIDLGAGQ